MILFKDASIKDDLQLAMDINTCVSVVTFGGTFDVNCIAFHIAHVSCKVVLSKDDGGRKILVCITTVALQSVVDVHSATDHACVRIE